MAIIKYEPTEQTSDVTGEWLAAILEVFLRESGLSAANAEIAVVALEDAAEAGKLDELCELLTADEGLAHLLIRKWAEARRSEFSSFTPFEDPLCIYRYSRTGGF